MTDLPIDQRTQAAAAGPANGATVQPTGLQPVATPGAFGALYRLVLRHQITRGRLLLFAVITGIAVLLGWVIGRSSGDLAQDGADVVSLFGFGLVVPVVALVLGSAALGNWVEDETLVYVWLRPVSRWVVAAAATLAAATVAVPVIVGSMTLLAALASAGDSGVIVGTAIGTALGGLAYTALFVAVGLIIRRALLWGLVYVFIWEFFVARSGTGAARLSINSYAASILAHWSEIEIRLADRGVTASYIVLAAVTAVAVGFTTWRLTRANVA
jgi:ABC-2 type transport system permease protein